jgi:hypothetical protein
MRPCQRNVSMSIYRPLDREYVHVIFVLLQCKSESTGARRGHRNRKPHPASSLESASNCGAVRERRTWTILPCVHRSASHLSACVMRKPIISRKHCPMYKHTILGDINLLEITTSLLSLTGFLAPASSLLRKTRRHQQWRHGPIED